MRVKSVDTFMENSVILVKYRIRIFKKVGKGNYKSVREFLVMYCLVMTCDDEERNIS
jgi:hypothetical protein